MRVVFALTLAVLFSNAAVVARAEEGDAIFRLKESTPRLGTNIVRDQVSSKAIPLNKGYREMTKEQRDIIRNWYEHLEDDDEPPYPVNGLAPIFKQVAKAQQSAPVDGQLRMDVVVDADGNASEVQVVESSTPDVSPQLQKYVAYLLMTEHYKPAVCAGRPCRMSLPFVIVFKTTP